MTDLQQGILTLIKSALLDKPLPLPPDFSLDGILPLCREHEITPMVCEGAVNCGLYNTPGFQPMFQESCQHLLTSERQAGLVRSIFSAFNKNGIEYMPVKGCLMKQRYPKHEFRPMADADILIREDQYEQIRPLMRQLGFYEGVESNHEYIWDSVSLHVELHKRLVPSYNKDYYAYFGDGWRLATGHKGTRFFMTPEDEFIYLFVHLAKHYRDGGVGCRQMVDLWVQRRSFPGLNEDYLRRELRKLHLLEFYDNVHKTLTVWFEDGAADEVTECITDFIFSAGAWGKEENHVLSDALREQKLAGSALGGKAMSGIKLVFPPYSGMAMHFPVLKKAPVLLPLMWPVRWLELLFVRRKSAMEKGALMRSATRKRVQSYQDQLNYVGLDFHFKEN